MSKETLKLNLVPLLLTNWNIFLRHKSQEAIKWYKKYKVLMMCNLRPKTNCKI